MMGCVEAARLTAQLDVGGLATLITAVRERVAAIDDADLGDVAREELAELRALMAPFDAAWS